MSWRTVNLGQLVENFSVRAKDHPAVTSELEFCGVSNEDGITKSKYAAEDKADDYKIIEKDCFAYNPYRINVGSIGLLEDDTVGLISPAYVVFKPKPRSIIPQLLLKFLKSAEGLRQIKMYARGTVRQALRFEDLCKIEIAIPDYDEQIEFFKRISETETESNILSTELTYQLDLVKQLRQAFLREAMQGKLVPQDENDEPASVLLEKIKAEKERLIKEKKIKKQKPLPPITEEEIAFEIPENWVWCRLGELSNDLLGGFAFKSSKYVKESKNQVIRLGNVKNDNLLLNANPAFVTDDYASIAEKARLLPGDILVTMTGTRAKRDYLFTLLLNDEHFENFNLYLNQRVGAFRLNDLLKKEFITFLLKEPSILEPVFLSSTGAANQANIGVTALNNILVPLPPLSEQQRIVAKLDELMGYCDELEASIKESQQQNELLLQQVLREALEPKEKEVEKV